MRSTSVPFERLNVLALQLVVEDVGDVGGGNTLVGGADVDSGPRHTDGPRRVADCHPDVKVVGLQVLACLHEVDNFLDKPQNVLGRLFASEQLEKRLNVGVALFVRRGFALACLLGGVRARGGGREWVFRNFFGGIFCTGQGNQVGKAFPD